MPKRPAADIESAAAADHHAQMVREFRWAVPAQFNIADVCSRRWAEAPDAMQRIAIHAHAAGGAGRFHSYFELQRAANGLSNALADLGVARGDRVAIVLPQRFETAVAYIAILQLAAVALPLSMLFGPEALEHRLTDSGAVVAICDEGALLHPLWFIAGGMITLLLAGLPFRLPQQYWRFSGLEDLLGVVGGSIVAAMLFSLLILLAGFPLPTTTFPVVHALVLMAMLGAPRVAYKLRRFRRRPDLAGQPVLLVGAGQGADLFLRALDYAPSGLRPVGLLATRSAQIGRRIHRQPILGELKQAGAVLDRLAAEGRLPAALVVTEPDLAGPPLAQLLEQAEARGIPVRRAPRPTALHPAARLELAPRRHRGPAEPAAGAPGPGGDGSPGAGAARAGHRRRRHHRQRAGPPGGRPGPRAPDPVGQRRIRAVADRPGTGRSVSRDFPRRPDHRYPRRRPGAAGHRRLPARAGIPRGGPEACADRGIQPAGRLADQRRRHPPRGRRRARRGGRWRWC